MGNGNSVLNDMKAQAERGAGTLVKSTQLQSEFAAKSAAAAEAHSKGQIWKDGGKGSGESGKSARNNMCRTRLERAANTFGPDGKKLTGKARKHAFQQSVKNFKKEKAAKWKSGWHN